MNLSEYSEFEVCFVWIYFYDKSLNAGSILQQDSPATAPSSPASTEPATPAKPEGKEDDDKSKDGDSEQQSLETTAEKKEKEESTLETTTENNEKEGSTNQEEKPAESKFLIVSGRN